MGSICDCFKGRDKENLVRVKSLDNNNKNLNTSLDEKVKEGKILKTDKNTVMKDKDESKKKINDNALITKANEKLTKELEEKNIRISTLMQEKGKKNVDNLKKDLELKINNYESVNSDLKAKNLLISQEKASLIVK